MIRTIEILAIPARWEANSGSYTAGTGFGGKRDGINFGVGAGRAVVAAKVLCGVAAETDGVPFCYSAGSALVGISG